MNSRKTIQAFFFMFSIRFRELSDSGWNSLDLYILLKQKTGSLELAITYTK